MVVCSRIMLHSTSCVPFVLLKLKVVFILLLDCKLAKLIFYDSSDKFKSKFLLFHVSSAPCVSLLRALIISSQVFGKVQ